MGLYSKRKLDNGATIAIWEITESEDDLRTLCSPIPNDELEELEILRSEARRKEKLAVRALLNELYPKIGMPFTVMFRPSHIPAAASREAKLPTRKSMGSTAPEVRLNSRQPMVNPGIAAGVKKAKTHRASETRN